MKFLTVLVFVFSGAAFGGYHEHSMEEMKKMPFDQHKAMMVEELDEKSMMVEQSKKCVDEAKDNDALIECHKKMKEEKHAMKEEMHDKMRDMKKKQ